MKNRFLSALGVVTVFAAILPAPPVLSLPAPPMRPQPPAAPGAAMPVQAIQITLDYVMTPEDLFHAESRRIAPGKQHDAQLMTALLKDGEFDFKQSPVAVHDGGLYRTFFFQGVSSQCLYLRVRPRINADRSITVRTKVRRDTLPAVPSHRGRQAAWHYRIPSTPAPSVSPSPPPVTNTFADGQTLLLSGCKMSYRKAGVPFLTVAFAKMRLVTMPPPTSAATPQSSHP